MNITGGFQATDMEGGQVITNSYGAFKDGNTLEQRYRVKADSSTLSSHYVNFDASRSWTGKIIIKKGDYIC